MIRVLLAAVIVAVLSPICHAGETVVRLNVQPMAAPKPALKYLLLPEVRELTPGNPAQWYLRSFQEQRIFFFSKEATAERARYLSMPLAELPAKKLRNYGGNALVQADWAARLDALDWQMVRQVQTDGLDLLLPELAPLRILGTALRVRFRGEIAERRFDDAIRTAKTMFALARHLGEHPTGAANRLGLTIADLALDTLDEMVQQPGCPNLYWALTDLPCPLVELRKGLQGDGALVATDLRPLRDDAPMTEEEIDKVVSRLSGVMGFAREQAGRTPRNLRAELKARVKNLEKVRAIRDRLLEARRAALLNRTGGEETVRTALDRLLEVGRAKDLIHGFPAVQVILLEEKRAYEVQRDERLKLLALAPWRIDALAAGEELGCCEEELLFADLLPDVLKARRTQGLLEQRIALLRHVEALRLYAAGHDGKLPAKLSDIAVPLPDDPFTGKPFHYQRDGAVAHLRGGSMRSKDCEWRYDVTLQK